MHDKRITLRRLAAVAIAASLPVGATTPAFAQSDPIRIGLILPMTGPFASTGRQVEAAAKLYMAQHGSAVAGRKV
ncbi:MAG: ABC transporter substrate-binding protein, partial [Burkholderiaceae bacterium]